MTITYDPKHAAYHDEADVRDEMTRVFDVCDGCRRCVQLCSSFPSLFEMLDAAGSEAGALTPAQQDRVADECFQCRLCRANCPYVPGLHELAIDFPRLMARTMAMRHSTGQRTIRATVADHVMGRTDFFGRWATRTAPAVNRMIGIEPGTVRRKVLAQLSGVTARGRLTPFARRRFSRAIRSRPTTGGPSAARRVTVFPTCLVEYRRPQLGTALLDVYSRNGIACDVARVGCCGAPWLTAGDTRRFAAQASHNVSTLAAAIRAGTDVVVAQPTCHAVIVTDYVDHVGGSDAELVAGSTFDALRYLADHVTQESADGSAGRSGRRIETGGSRGDGSTFGPPTRIVHHEPCPVLGDESRSPARRLLEMTGATVVDVRRSIGVDARWALRVANEPIGLAIASELGAEVERSAADVICGSCVLTNTSIAEQTGREVVHPLELLAGGTDFARQRGRRRGEAGDAV
jgi:glycerol-3-phosphate dehydrogenase subunit C